MIGWKVSAKTIKLLEENTGENLLDFGLDKDFLGTTLKTQSKKDRNWYTGPHQHIKTSVFQKKH